jgi:hypothetical protein
MSLVPSDQITKVAGDCERPVAEFFLVKSKTWPTIDDASHWLEMGTDAVMLALGYYNVCTGYKRYQSLVNYHSMTIIRSVHN